MPIRATLLSIVGLLGLLIACFAFGDLWQADRTVRRGDAALTTIPDQLALAEISVELGRESLDVYARLSSPRQLIGEDLERFDAMLGERQRIVDAALAALDDPAIQDVASAAIAPLQALRQRAVEEVSGSAFLRDMAFAQTWLDSTAAALDRIVVARRGALPADGSIDIETFRLLLALDDLQNFSRYMLIESADMGGLLVSRGHLSTAQAIRLGESHAFASRALDLVVESVDRVDSGPVSRPVAALAAAFDEEFSRLRAIILSALIDGTPMPDMPGQRWFEQASLVLDATAPAGRALAARLVSHLEGVVASASRTRTISALFVSASLLAIVLSGIALQRQVLTPLSAAVRMLGRVSDGDLDVDAAGLPVRHEMGALRAALVRLVAVSRQARALTAEQVRLDADRQAAIAAQQEGERARAAARQADAEAESARTTAQREAEREAAREIAMVVAACAKGDFSHRLPLAGKSGTYRDMCIGLNEVGDAAADGLDGVRRAMQALADGDLTHRMPVDRTGIFAETAEAVNAMTDRLAQGIGRLSAAGHSVSISSSTIGKSATELTRQTETAAATLEQTYASVATISDLISGTARSTDRIRGLTEQSVRDVATSSETLASAREAMADIERSSQEVAKFIAIIDDIAFQTNLLALNAGVEAARAGDSGRGFSVVADAVRMLAHRSADAAREITGVVDRSRELIDRGVGMISDCDASLIVVRDATTEIAAESASVAEAAQDGARGISEVEGALRELDALMGDTVVMCGETLMATRGVGRDAAVVVRIAETFELGREGSLTRARADKSSRAA